MSSVHEKAQSIIESRAKATPAPLKAEGMGSEGYNLYAQVDGGSYRDNLDTLGFRGCIGEIRAGKDWAQLRGNAEYIEKVWNDAPDIAHALIEAIEHIEDLIATCETCNGRGTLRNSRTTTEPERECPNCNYSRRFLASLDKEGANNG